MKKKPTKRDGHNLCPGCSEPVSLNRNMLYDRRERVWHHVCALRALSDHFRTPLDLSALDGELIEFEIGDASIKQYSDHWTAFFRAPRDFVLRAIRFGSDFGLSNCFVGADNVLGTLHAQNAIFGDDLEARLLPVGETVVHTGIDITMNLHPRPNSPPPRLTLVGELFDPKKRTALRDCSPFITAVGLHGLVQPHALVTFDASVYAPTHFERLAADDHVGWVIERVSLCCFAGDALSEMGRGEPARITTLESKEIARPLKGRITQVPTFTAQPGEWISLTLRNTAPEARSFTGRLIGQYVSG